MKRFLLILSLGFICGKCFAATTIVGGPTISSGGSGGGLSSNEVYQIVEDYSGGGGAAVSNAVGITFATETRYTNNTAYYAEVSAAINLSQVGGAIATLTYYQDINLDGTSDFNRSYSMTMASGTHLLNPVMREIVPPGAAYAFTNASGGGSIASFVAAKGAVTYYSTNTGGGGGSGDVTQSGLAAGSYPIAETALTGFLRFSSTNTAFLDGAATAYFGGGITFGTNAITVVSNVFSYSNFTLPSQISQGVDIGGTYYRKEYGVYTNGAIGAVFYDAPNIDEYQGNIQFTNAAHDELDTDILAICYSAFNLMWFDTGDEVMSHLGSSFTPSLFPSAVVTLSTPAYASFNGKHVGDGSLLTNLPVPAGILTNNWQSSAGAVNITNTVNVGRMSIKEGDIRYNFQSPYTNSFIINSNYAYFGASGNTLFDAYQFRWGLNSEAYFDLGSWGNFLMRARYIGLEAPNDYSTIRLTDDHRLDGLVKLAGQSTQAGLVFSTNNYSGMLAFQAPKTNGAGTYIPGYAGIRAKNATGIEKMNVNGEPMSESELWFYTLIPPQMSNVLGGFRSVGDTNWFAIGKTNALYVKGLTVVSNYINQWPTVPHTPGDAQFVNSNGYPYILLSTNGGGGGAATWTATNKIGW